MILRPSQPPDAPNWRKVSVSDLITQANEAVQRMGNSNPHKFLIFNLAMALRQLVDRVAELESQAPAPSAPIAEEPKAVQ